MKRTFAAVLLLALFFSAFAQDGNLKKQTYLRFGFSVPTWKYRGLAGKQDWPDDMKKVGGVFEVGSIFMLNSIKLSPGMRLGINVDYLSVNVHHFNDESIIGMTTSNFVFVGSKVGPSFSYSPVKRLVLDAFVKFNPVWVAGDFITSEAGDNFYLGYMGIKYSVGMNVRYSVLMLGLEYNPGYAKLRWFDKDEKKLTDVYLSNVNDNGKNTPVPGMNFTIGLSF